MEFSKAKISRYAMLRHKKYRDREGLFIAQGRKVVEDTLPFFELEALIEDAESIRKISTLENLPDVIAVFRKPETVPSNGTSYGENEFMLAIDGVQDPGNLGTIIRTAHWFGIKRLYCSPSTVDLYNPKVIMATMGSIAKITVEYCNLPDLFRSCPHIPVYGLAMEGENLFTQKNLEPGFVVMGSEGHGQSQETLDCLTRKLTIPSADPSDHPDSLNVAIATAITLSQLVK